MMLLLRKRLDALWRQLRGEQRAGARRARRLVTANTPSQAQIHAGLEGLPPDYGRAFTAAPPPREEALETQAAARSALVAAFRGWREGRSAVSVVTGPPGSGRSSMLAAFERQACALDVRVTRLCPQARPDSAAALIECMATSFGLSRPVPPANAPLASKDDAIVDGSGVSGLDSALDALVDGLLAAPKRVVIIEDVQRLFSRRMGMRESHSAFADVLLRTREHCMWVLSAPTLAWARLDALAGFSEIATDKIECSALSSADLRALVLARHAASGLELHLERGEDEAALAPGTPEYDAQLELYFLELHALSAGNPAAAFHFWLLSVGPAADAKALLLHNCPELSLPSIDGLAPQLRLMLVELLVHGGLSANAVAALFQLPPSAARVDLERLRVNGLVTREPSGEYALSVLMHPHVSAALKRAHLLY